MTASLHRLIDGRFGDSNASSRLLECNEPVAPNESHKVDGVRPTVDGAEADQTELKIQWSELLKLNFVSLMSAFMVVDQKILEPSSFTVCAEALPGANRPVGMAAEAKTASPRRMQALRK